MIESLSIKVSELNKFLKSKKDKKQVKDENWTFLLDLPLFKNNNYNFEFKKGLNVIYADNKTGKSTLMKMLATTLGCYQGGSSLYTSFWLNQDLEDNIAFNLSDSTAKELNIDIKSDPFHFFNFVVANVVHDGQHALFCDPKKTKGLRYGGAEIDYDFIEDFKNSGDEKHSTGALNKKRMADILDLLSGKLTLSDFPREIKNKIDFPLVGERYNHINELIKATIPVSAKTIFLDEPDNALDLESQRNLFKLIKKNENRDDLQIILISHSPLVFSFDNANYISEDLEKLNRHKELVKSGMFFDLD